MVIWKEEDGMKKIKVIFYEIKYYKKNILSFKIFIEYKKFCTFDYNKDFKNGSFESDEI